MRFVLKQADPRTLAGLYKYGPATIWVSGPSGGTWWATVKFRSQEKDFDARTYEGVMNAAIRWIDEAPELSRSKRDPKRPGFYVQAPLGPYHQDITSQARWALGLGRETRYPQNPETLHATLPSGMKVRLLRKPSRSTGGAHRTTDRLQAYCEYCGKWFGTGNIDQHQIVHGVGSERQLQRYEQVKSKGYPASLKRHRESSKAQMKTWKVYWAPEGRVIATVDAKDARSAIRKAPQPYRKYLGEMYAEEASGQRDPDGQDYVLVYGGSGTRGFAVSKPFVLKSMAIDEAKALSRPNSYGDEVRVGMRKNGRVVEIGRAKNGVYRASPG